MTSAGQTNKRLVTGIAFKDTREINPNIIDVANETGFDDLMMIIEGYKPTIQPNYHHFVNEDIFQVLTFDAGGVSGSGTANLTVTITSTGFAREGLKLKFYNDKVGIINSAITTASTKDAFTITSVDGTNLTAVAGDKVSPMGIVMGEGSDAVTPLSYGQTKYFNLVEHMKDSTEITDIQEASTIETGTGYEAYLQAINQAQSFKTQISWTLLGGVKSISQYGDASPTLVDKYGGTVQTTGGLDGEANAYGIVGDVATNGTYALTDIDNLCDAIIAVKGPAGYLQLCPDAAKRKANTMHKNLGSSGVTSSRLEWNGNTMDYNVDSFTYGKFNFDYGKLDLLDHPQLTNFAGASAIGKTIYGIPKDKVKVQAGPSGKGGQENRIGVRYLPNKYANKNQGTAWVREWYTGANNDNPTSAKEVRTCHISTTQGFEGLGFRQVFHQRVLV
jgi:hypothetical protein